MSKQTEEKISGLRCITQAGEVGGPAVILFHGYGADQYDLAPLGDLMNLGPKFSWYFPNGPMEIIIAPGMKGRAWYQIDIRRIENLLQEGKHADLSMTRPQGLDQAVQLALKFYESIAAKHSKVFVGGFSQGSMLAVEVGLRAEKRPAGLIILSGNLVDKITTESLAKKAKGLPFIQAHGVNDVILSHLGGENLFALLSAAGLKGRFYSFRGGHEIPNQVLKEASGFISSHS